MFSDGVKNIIRDEQKAEQLLQTLNWAKNPEIFVGKKVPGSSKLAVTPIKNLVMDLAISDEGEEGLFPLERRRMLTKLLKLKLNL